MRRFLNFIEKNIKSERLAKKLNPNTYPTNKWYRRHLDRNYDVVCLGNSRYFPKITFPNRVKGFDWSLKDQNLEWDFNVLKHFFSILKPGGVAVFPLTDFFVSDLMKGTSECRYYTSMMPYFFSSSPAKRTFIRICKRIPLIPLLVLGGLKLQTKRTRGMPGEKIKKLLAEICSFCEERDIRPLFIFVRSGEANIPSEVVSCFENKGNCYIFKKAGFNYNWNLIESII